MNQPNSTKSIRRSPFSTLATQLCGTRNRDAIVGYQKAMIAHLHGNAAFDKWNTSLANQLSQRQSSMVPAQFCQQSMPLLEQAKTLDAAKFRAYAVSQATSANCGK